MSATAPRAAPGSFAPTNNHSKTRARTPAEQQTGASTNLGAPPLGQERSGSQSVYISPASSNQSANWPASGPATSTSRTVPLSAEAMEGRVRDQLERGELTMGEIRADYARYCK